MTTTKRLKFENLRIQFSNAIVGNFLRLPHSIINVLESTNYAIQEFGIAVHSHNSDIPIVHLGWDGHDSGSSENVVLINPVLATVYDLNQKSPLVDLYIQRYDHTHLATEVYVTPETSDDWEIIDANAMRFQNGEILHQTRIVTPGETLICYLEGIVTKFKIDRVEPSMKSARITDGSLVVVAPKVNKTRLVKADDGAQLPSQKGYASIVKCSLRQSKKSDSDNKSVGIPSKKIGVFIKCDSQIPENHIALSSHLWDAFFTHPMNGAKIKLEFLQMNQANIISGRNATVNIKYFGKDVPTKSGDQYSKLLGGSLLTNNLILPTEQIIIEIKKGESEQQLCNLNEISNESVQWKVIQMGKEEVKDIIERHLPKHYHVKETGEVSRTSKDEDDFITVNSIKKEMVNYLTSPIIATPAIILDGKQGIGKTRLLKELINEVKKIITSSLNMRIVKHCTRHQI
ncbi:CBM_collapsed_G0033800.mRNA.1.CDS.1 [Saccharomyces cerevisiae]|nr:CBM_collapsed_G0033800.mRNA.1.CDS.1 [Saccharomyces cerevisiae]